MRSCVNRTSTTLEKYVDVEFDVLSGIFASLCQTTGHCLRGGICRSNYGDNQ